MDSEKAKWGMSKVMEDPIIDEEEEELMKKMETEFRKINLEDQVEGQQYHVEGQAEGEYGSNFRKYAHPSFLP